MTGSVVNFLHALPPEIAVMVLAAVPIIELRGALPVALLIYKLPLASALFWALLGNIIPIYFLLMFFEHFAAWIRPRSARADRWLTWLFARTRRKWAKKVKKHGAWALALLVATPLPGTGAWNGALAAFVFGLPKKKALLSITLGTIIAALIVTLITLGAAATVKALLL